MELCKWRVPLVGSVWLRLERALKEDRSRETEITKVTSCFLKEMLITHYHLADVRGDTRTFPVTMQSKPAYGGTSLQVGAYFKGLRLK